MIVSLKMRANPADLALVASTVDLRNNQIIFEQPKGGFDLPYHVSKARDRIVVRRVHLETFCNFEYDANLVLCSSYKNGSFDDGTIGQCEF